MNSDQRTGEIPELTSRDPEPQCDHSTPAQGFDLLRFRPLRAILLWSGFPYVAQTLMLAVFVLLAVTSWNVFAPAGVNAKLFAKTNLGTLLVWGIWWPAMIWLAVLLGRVWCMVCPMELVSNISERLARSLGFPQKRLSRWIASGVIIVALYAVIQLLVAGLHIHRVPAYTSMFLIGLLGLTVLTSIVFSDRAFCRGFCPIGLLLGTYGRGGMLAIRAGSVATCQACKGKQCLDASNRTALDARSCPTLLYPPKLNSNKDCLLCGQCIKSCQPGNMRILLRAPFAKTDSREGGASWPVTLFVLMVSGFVLWELFTEWPKAEKMFLRPPVWLASQLDFSTAGPWFEGLWVLFVVPVGLWLVFAGMVRLAGHGDSVGNVWRQLALPLAVVVSAGHMSKGLAKLVSWSPFLPHALQDPGGAQTAAQISGKIIASPGAFIGLPTVASAALLLVLAATTYGLREYRLAHGYHRRSWHGEIPILAMGLLYGLIVVGWILQ